MNKTIGIVGATGIVGREILSLLKGINKDKNEIFCFASSNTSVNDFEVKKIDFDILKTLDYVIFCASDDISRKYAKKLADLDVTVIDKTSVFRMDPNVPLVIPEINMDEINLESRIIATPNCTMIITLMAIYPIIKELGAKDIYISSYQSTSGAGLKGLQELIEQTKQAFVSKDIPKDFFKREIIFNLIPQIGSCDVNGHTTEEQKIIEEFKKITSMDINIHSTCIRVPTLIGHGISIFIKTDQPASKDNIIDIINNAGIANYEYDPMKATCQDSVNSDKVIVSRVRTGSENEISNDISLWVVGNNLRKGAALNALQIIYKMENSTLF